MTENRTKATRTTSPERTIPPERTTPPERTRPPADASVELVGERRTRVDAGDLADLPFERRAVEIACASGSRYVSTWVGVAIPDLLSVGTVPPATTHLVFESPDGHAACVGVEEAVEGLLAWSCDGRPLADDHSYANRFVSPAVAGVRTVKGVCRIEAVALSPDDRPGDFETRATETPDLER